MISLRRRFVPLSLVVLFAAGGAVAQPTEPVLQGWDACPGILKRISPPAFPHHDFLVTPFGAVGDDKTDCTAAFKRAIEKCHQSGGGRVVVPKGVYQTGALHLLSNVNLHILKDAVIKFSTDPKKYLPLVYTRWEGVECMNYSALIYAFEQENIAVTGEGLLDAQGANDNWWGWNRRREKAQPKQAEARNRLNAMGEKDVPVAERIMGEGSFLRPNFFQPYKCKNILVEGVTFKDSPMWFVNPVLCTNVSVIGVTTEGQGPNNDGCDPESCTDVLIKNCYFNTGDDCIAIKSGRNNDGRRVNVPCSNIIVQGCRMKNGHGGVSLGSECSGGIRNVYAENDTMDSPLLDRMLRIKTNSVRGGVVENIFFRNISIGQVKDAVVHIDFSYEEGDRGSFTPMVRNVELRNIESTMSKYAVWIRCYDRSPAENVTIEQCTFNNVTEPNVIENVRGLTMVGNKIFLSGKSAAK
ncbi:MAG: glycoside hydrolase family 28 protein [Ignavibacteriae bacterium]|nr:MAG: glycoside hydrolase family 28 protein [Ignavibacteriota bacterium]